MQRSLRRACLGIVNVNSTRESLLARVRNRSDDDAWQQFHRLYAPLLYRYARARGLARADAEEVRDQCLEVVAREMPDFEYDRTKGGFKSWLRRIANSKAVDLLRKRREHMADSQQIRAVRDSGPTPDEIWERQWEHQHLKYCVEQVRQSVSAVSYEIFHMLLFEQRSVKDVCVRLGLTPNQVYKAKARVLRRVRQKLAEAGIDINH